MAKTLLKATPARWIVGPWELVEYRELDADPYYAWTAPEGVTTQAVLDLRPLGVQATLSDDPLNFSVWRVDPGLAIPTGCVDLGVGTPSALSLSKVARDVFQKFTTPRVPGTSTLEDVIKHLFYTDADIDGVDGPRPIMPKRGVCAAYGMSFPFTWPSPEAARMIAFIRSEYRKVREHAMSGNATNPNVHRMWMHRFLSSNRIDSANYRAFQPNNVPDESPLRPATPITESFPGTSATLGGDLSWTEHYAAGWQNVSGQAYQSASTPAAARCDTDLAAGDMYAQNYQTAASGYGWIGPTVRHDSSADTCYAVWERYADSGSYNRAIHKRVSGSVTYLATDTNVDRTSAAMTLKLTVEGSDLEYFRDGTSMKTVTDTSISSSNVRAGLVGRKNGEAYYGDDWEADAIVTTTYVDMSGTVAATTTNTPDMIEVNSIHGTVTATSSVVGSITRIRNMNHPQTYEANTKVWPTVAAEGTGAVSSWSGPSNGAVSDNVRATNSITALGSTKRLDVHTFDWSVLPYGCLIDGMEVTIEGFATTATDVYAGEVRFFKGTDDTDNVGALYGDYSYLLPSSEGLLVIGGPMDDWSFTSDQVKRDYWVTNALGVYVAFGNLHATLARTVYVDSIHVDVYYTVQSLGRTYAIGDMIIAKKLTGSVSVTSTTAGTACIVLDLAGTVSATSTLWNSVLYRTRTLSAGVVAASTVSAGLDILIDMLSTDIDTVSGCSGVLSVPLGFLDLVGNVLIVSGGSATLNGTNTFASPGIIAGTSVVGRITGPIQCRALSQGASSVVGTTLEIVRDLGIATCDATSSFTISALDIVELVQGTIGGSALVTGSVDMLYGLTGIVESVSGVNGVLTRVDVAASTGGVSSVVGNLSAASSLTGVVNAVGQLSGALDMTRDLVGLVDGVVGCTSSGSSLRRRLSSALSGVSSLASPVLAASAVMGIVQVESTTAVLGALSVTRSFNGNVSGQAAILAGNTRVRTMDGSIAALLSPIGGLDVNRELVGTVALVATVSAELNNAFMDGSVAVNTTVNGTLSMKDALDLVAVLSPTATVVGSATRLRGFTAEIGAEVSSLPSLSIDSELVGTVVSSSTSDVESALLKFLGGSSDTISTIAGTIDSRSGLSTTATAVSTCVGQLDTTRNLEAYVEVVAYAVGRLTLDVVRGPYYVLGQVKSQGFVRDTVYTPGIVKAQAGAVGFVASGVRTDDV